MINGRHLSLVTEIVLLFVFCCDFFLFVDFKLTDILFLS